MKIMIASDIHGSAYYCELMINAFKKEGADKLLLLGDLLYHGPRNELPKEYNPGKVANMLNEMKKDILCVRGNCDSEVDQMVLEFPIMADYCTIFMNGRMLFATHGHKFNEENPPQLNKGDILLNGHFHVTKYTEHKDFIYMNPGSVSLPKEDSIHGYLLIDEENAYWKDFDRNVIDAKIW